MERAGRNAETLLVALVLLFAAGGACNDKQHAIACELALNTVQELRYLAVECYVRLHLAASLVGETDEVGLVVVADTCLLYAMQSGIGHTLVDVRRIGMEEAGEATQPLIQRTVVSGGSPLAAVNPSCPVSGMSCRQNGSISRRCKGKHLCHAVGGHFQFIADGRSGEKLRRVAYLLVAHAVLWAQGLLVEPFFSRYTIIIRNGTGMERRYG